MGTVHPAYIQREHRGGNDLHSLNRIMDEATSELGFD